MGGTFERKIYDKMSEWKRKYSGEYALLIEGARRVGKTTVVREFAKKEYRSFIFIDFSDLKPATLDLFKEGAGGDYDGFLSKLSLFEKVKLYPRESVIVFDEVQLFPKARQMIKHLVEDGRYDYIETGSLITLKSNVKNILIPSEEKKIRMYPMDFEEFLWATGDDVTADMIRRSFDEKKPMGGPVHDEVMKRFRQYMAVGGMPQAVSKYINTGDYMEVDAVKNGILDLYKDDIVKIPTKLTSEKASLVFGNIPSLLSNNSKLFSPSKIKRGSRTRSYLSAVEWLKKAHLINVCYNSRDPDATLMSHVDTTSFKCYMADTGLLISHSLSSGNSSLEDTYEALILNRLSANKGMLFENVVAQELTAKGYDLFFTTFPYKGENDGRSSGRVREIDFLIPSGKRLTVIETKSSGSTRHKSFDEFLELHPEKVERGIVIGTRDLEEKDGVLYLPVYMTGLL